MRSPNRYIIIFFAAAVMCAMVTCAFNFVVDPYGVFGDVSIRGFNKIKPVNNRFFAPIIATKGPSDFVVMGSSRVRSIIRAMKELRPDERIVDGHLDALRAREAIEVLTLFKNRKEIKDILFGLDFFSFNARHPYHPSFVPGIINQGELWRPKLMAVFGVSALQASIKTVGENLLLGRSKQRGIGSKGGGQSANLRQEERFQEVLMGFQVTFYQDFKLDVVAMKQLGRLLKEVTANGKRVYLFIGPSHALQWEAVHKSGKWADFEAWKQSLAQMAQATGISVWDFAAFSSVSTVPVDKSIRWYSDSSHFNTQAAELVVTCIFEEKGCDTLDGARLEPSSVDARLGEVRQKRLEWLARKGTAKDLKLLALP